jgi:hypothetical protein
LGYLELSKATYYGTFANEHWTLSVFVADQSGPPPVAMHIHIYIVYKGRAPKIRTMLLVEKRIEVR